MKKYKPISDSRSQLIGHIAASKNDAGIAAFATIDFFSSDGVLVMTFRCRLEDLNVENGQLNLVDEVVEWKPGDITIKAIPPESEARN